jgi:hypothetical protein
LVLAVRADGDIVYRLLTSREYHRVREPACVQSGDRPGYFMGIPQPVGALNRATWLDLREVEDDYDSVEFRKLEKASVLEKVHTVPLDVLCPALSCAAYAQDTTRAQKNCIMQSRASLGCP